MSSSNFDNELEDRAASTLFFYKEIIEGQTRNTCRVNYLALLHLHIDVAETIETIRKIISSETRNNLEKDTRTLLQAKNWRFHLIACGVLLAGYISNLLLDELWNTLEQRSWVSPQLAATAYLLDPAFGEKGLTLLMQDNTDDKSVIAVSGLLRKDSELRFTTKQELRISSAKEKDYDNSEQLTFTWIESARFYFAN